ncbi:uncharacterized protein PODANS_3_2060 [Podospora anserina S mat+]|uniref:Pleiotropic ABC efflux transporter of multiple drugs n=1 Tax=Podospora anserina (strain S / ATCC MYA-4624 / DSM 980 / FGSC 10383) TaxID=515849 RepID=B2AZY5_PODAN|nr:uncharacterized protein PODANS_3_2060 [Podospora anserina S mat+]CAP70103.1 unnamed protein product [Podospora anserina S mat+]CDP26697.1 Putative Pleiotropic ABC efflux transporter of multiple drugs [Podospora anserina S mat+]
MHYNEQIMPMFIPQRNLYEARERLSKVYHWTTFVTANVLIELGWSTLMEVIIFFCWYYPVGFVRNSTPDDQTIRGFLVFLFLWEYLLFTSTVAHFAIVWIDLPEEAGVLTTLLWVLCILFCGIGVLPGDLPAFWKFMYRVSPATYLAGGICRLLSRGQMLSVRTMKCCGGISALCGCTLWSILWRHWAFIGCFECPGGQGHRGRGHETVNAVLSYRYLIF